MKAGKAKKLKDAGWKTGTADEFLGLSDAEAALVEMKLALIAAVKAARTKRGLSQVALAKRMRSSQSRIAKIETGDPSISLDLMVRAFLATGATPRELSRVFS